MASFLGQNAIHRSFHKLVGGAISSRSGATFNRLTHLWWQRNCHAGNLEWIQAALQGRVATETVSKKVTGLIEFMSCSTCHFFDATSVYRNKLDIPANQPAAAPGSLSAVVGPGRVTFGWGAATDDITPANLLTYNLRVGTTPGGTDTVSPLANPTTGWRKIAAPGNVGHCFSTFYRFPPGTYYWSMQAVDGAFAGGAWAAEQTFVIPEPPVAGADTVHRLPGRTIKIPVATLLANDSSPRSDPLSVTAVSATSTGGVSVQRVDDMLLYTPVGSFNDTFTYTLSDGTSTATGTVTVIVDPPSEAVTQNLVGTFVEGGGALQVTAAGIPGRSYQLQRTASLTSPATWSNLGAAQAAPAHGQMTFTDPTPVSPHFYRVVAVP